MTNGDTEAAREYHERTKHSPASVRASGHVLDWANRPLPFKIYEQLEPIPLPREWPTTDVPALAALGSAVDAHGTRTPSLAELARLLHLAAGITKKVVYPNGVTQYFRAAACTGALYHIDLYVVCGALGPDLEAGVYHFSPQDFSLRRLRAGDHRAVIVAATADEPAIAAAPAILISTSTWWRNAWKYQTRAYRHAYWDDGTILANLLAAAAAADVPARVVLGFVDATINALLGVDPAHEAALSLVALGHDPASRPPDAPSVPALAPVTTPLSAREITYPAIVTAHEAGMLDESAEVAAWRRATVAAPPTATGAADATIVALPQASAPAGRTIDEVIGSRGSTRAFGYRALSIDALSALVAAADAAVPADFTAPGARLAHPYLIVNAVEGVASGAYAYDRERHALELIRTGDFRERAGFLGLGQELPADASVNVYLLADLETAFARFGNRGYRAAQLDAAIAGGKLYLAAYALGLGATGLTFFDDDVTAFFSPHAAGKSVMFLVAIGVPRKSRPRVSS